MIHHQSTTLLAAIISSLVFLGLFHSPAYSADIKAISDRGGAFILVRGRIKIGDSEAFNNLVTGKAARSVILNGGGGDLWEAFRLGEEIKRRNLATAVLENDICAGTCAFIWLAGSTRYLAPGSKLGFHWMFNLHSRPTMGGSYSSTVGAYIAKIGLPTRVAAYIMKVPETEPVWSDPANLAAIGVRVELKAPPRLFPKIKKEISAFQRLTDVKRNLLQNPVYAEANRRYPLPTAQYIAAIYEAAFDIDAFVLVGLYAVNNAIHDYIRRHASDATLYRLVKLRYQDMKALSKTDPETCVRHYFFPRNYDKRRNRIPDQLVIGSGVSKILTSRFENEILRALQESDKQSTDLSFTELPKAADDALDQINRNVASKLTPYEYKVFFIMSITEGQWRAALSYETEGIWDTDKGWKTACDITNLLWDEAMRKDNLLVSLMRAGEL